MERQTLFMGRKADKHHDVILQSNKDAVPLRYRSRQFQYKFQQSLLYFGKRITGLVWKG